MIDRCVSMSMHFLSIKNRNRNGSQRYCCLSCLGLALAMGFTEAMSSSSLVSIDSVTYLSTPFTILTQEAVLSWNRDLTRTSIVCWSSSWQTFMTKTGPILVFLRIHPHIRVLSHCEASYILGMNVASVVLLFQEYRSTVLVRQASNLYRNTVWIISGLLTFVRISSRLPFPVHW